MDAVSYSRLEARPAQSKADRHRVAWVDTAKGICIIFVVMMHSTLGAGAEMGGEGFMHWVVAFARPFRMPDFFLVSGLFLARVIDRDWRSYADKRVLHFAYFYLLWLVIQSGLKYGGVSNGSALGFLQHLAVSLVEPYSTLWFIYILAVFSLVTKALRRVPPAVILAAAAALQIMPIHSNWYLVEEFCDRWVYFLVGYLFATQIFAVAGAAGERPRRALALLALWALVNGALALTPIQWGHATTLAELPGVEFLAGLAGAIAIVALAALVTLTGRAGFLRYCGQNSIAIYLAFFLPMAVTRTLLIGSGVADVGLVSLVTTIIAVLVPLAIERLVRHTPLFFLFRRPALFHLKAAKARPSFQPAE
jgi:uncharacterized membrane protein YcfT